MKITSFNLAGYREWDDREPRITSFIDAVKPDVICFQEVMFDGEHAPYAQSKVINSKLTEPYLYHHASVSRFYLEPDGSGRREGLGVLSRYAINDSEIIALPKRPDDIHYRIVQKLSLTVLDKVVHLANVHFSDSLYAAEQLEETLEIMEQRQEKCIIVGDYNIYDSNVVSRLSAPLYTASTNFAQYISYPSEGATLDYVLAPNDFEFSSLRVDEGLSDHNVLTVEVGVSTK